MKGRFKPRNYQKYIGDPTNIIYRSSWELDFFRFCDSNDSIVAWGSEEIRIPYRLETDGRIHTYYPDVVLKTSNNQTILVEIKPYKETIEPDRSPKKRKKTYITEVMTYIKNQSKWKAAEKYCADKGWKFLVITEKTLYGGIR